VYSTNNIQVAADDVYLALVMNKRFVLSQRKETMCLEREY
jgi:hypothetical protein